jgi:hypothetical protein
MSVTDKYVGTKDKSYEAVVITSHQPPTTSHQLPATSHQLSATSRPGDKPVGTQSRADSAVGMEPGRTRTTLAGDGETGARHRQGATARQSISGLFLSIFWRGPFGVFLEE